MELFLIILIVTVCIIYLFFHIRKVLIKGERSNKCANCPLLNMGNTLQKNESEK